MKKLIVLLGGLLLAGQAMAAVSIVNENSINNIEVSYRYCQTNQSPAVCTAPSMITAEVDKVAALPPAPANTDLLVIVSALEKDSSGKIIAQGNYEYQSKATGFSHCGYPLFNGTVSNNILISLSDMRQKSMIRCLANGY